MNFFEQQAQARTATKRLVLLYILAVASIVATLTIVAHFLFLVQKAQDSANAYGTSLAEAALPYDLFIALAILAVIAAGTLVRVIQVGSSGEKVARMLGGVPVEPDTRDALERRLMNVVEEMSIASGMPVPRVFILPDEDGINAFAAGMRPGEAVIAVTRGTLTQLTRDELQGVVAHEFSHIFNGDMRLNLRLMGVLGGILVIATIGRLFFDYSPRSSSSSSSSSSKKNDAGALVIFGLAMFVIGYIGVFFARLIKAAVSRQREYLADASAVQFTRNPAGIGGALMKIRGYAPASRIRSHYAEEASHMFFGSALNFSSMFATHPPLEERIGRVDPQLLKSGTWIPKPALSAREAEEASAAGLEVTAGFADAASAPDSPRSPVQTPTASRPTSPGQVPLAHEVVASIGAPDANDVSAARKFLDSIPASIRERTRDRQGAVLLAVALFIESEIQPAQMQILSSALNTEEVKEIVAIRDQLSAVGEDNRLALLDITIPPLRHLTMESKTMLLELCKQLVHSDEVLNLYEYVALALLDHQLLRDTRPRKAKPAISSARTANDLSTLLSAVAYAGASDVTAAKRAFDTGSASIKRSLSVETTFRSMNECTLNEISSSIERLSYLAPASQQKVIAAVVETILLDATVTEKESQLLRGLCAVLEAPLPALAV